MSNELRTGWKVWFPEYEDEEDIVDYYGWYASASQVAKDAFLHAGDISNTEVAVISPEGERTLWDVYETRAINAQQMEWKRL